MWGEAFSPAGKATLKGSPYKRYGEATLKESPYKRLRYRRRSVDSFSSRGGRA